MLRRVQRMRASVGMRALFLEQSFETCACVCGGFIIIIIIIIIHH
jgi:hypothetical protein